MENIKEELKNINNKLDMILRIVTPKISELQDKEILSIFRNIDPLRDIIGTPDNFNETTDKIINENKLI